MDYKKLRSDVGVFFSSKLRLLKVILWCWLCVIKITAAVTMFGTVESQAQSLGIRTGGECSPYYRIGEDLKLPAKQLGVSLNVKPSLGSVENIYKLLTERGTELAIAQADVLRFIYDYADDKRFDDKNEKYLEDIRVVSPLYEEEVHLITAGEKFNNFHQLSDARVAVGEIGSGTYITSSIILEKTGIQPVEEIFDGYPTALEKLNNGEIDAMFHVVGYPDERLTKLSGHDELKLINIPIKDELDGVSYDLSDGYEFAELPSNPYPWHLEKVETISIKAMLLTFDYDNEKGCDYIGKIGSSLSLEPNLKILRENGHPKWKSVKPLRLDEDLPKGWKYYQCVETFVNLQPMIIDAEKAIRDKEASVCENTIMKDLNAPGSDYTVIKPPCKKACVDGPYEGITCRACLERHK